MGDDCSPREGELWTKGSNRLAEQWTCWLGPKPAVTKRAGMEVVARFGEEFRPCKVY